MPELEEMAEARKLHLQRVTWVHHWTNGLFSFRLGGTLDVDANQMTGVYNGTMTVSVNYF